MGYSEKEAALQVQKIFINESQNGAPFLRSKAEVRTMLRSGLGKEYLQLTENLPLQLIEPSSKLILPQLSNFLPISNRNNLPLQAALAAFENVAKPGEAQELRRRIRTIVELRNTAFASAEESKSNVVSAPNSSPCPNPYMATVDAARAASQNNYQR